MLRILKYYYVFILLNLQKFKDTITNAKSLTERKRYYVSNYGIENYIDIVNGKTNEIVKAPNFDRYYSAELIEWWRKNAGGTSLL